MNSEFFALSTPELRKIRDNQHYTETTRMAARLEILRRIGK